MLAQERSVEICREWAMLRIVPRQDSSGRVRASGAQIGIGHARCRHHTLRLRLIRMPGCCPELTLNELLNQHVKINGLSKCRSTSLAEFMAIVCSPFVSA